MADLPTGTVTLLFTDVEGSTRLWELAPAAMREAMVHHDALVEENVVREGGQMVRPRGEGDSRFAVFVRASQAVAAARDIQQALFAHAWPTPMPLRVRMALHSGEADLRTGDYYGSEVNRCARLRALAHGGQTLLSHATFDLIRDALPEMVAVRDLGQHRLKDLQRPEHVYQLEVIGLPAAFPPLQSVDVFPNNLPVQLTSFVGREQELSEIKHLLQATHLLTVTGPGGTGKTRLCLQLAAEVLEAFADGVWLVELAPLTDSALIAQTIASTLGVREQPGRAIRDALVDYLRAKNSLLILDNCEHLIAACAQLADILLRAAPRLKILATSREALGIAGETAYRLPSLPLPDVQAASLDALAQNDCVRLFVDRATAADPHFRFKGKNAPTIADICRRLDGIPLAIELAAVRTKVFPPEQIAARLDDRFRLLTGGSRTALERHQTLRALIDWSYDLLSEPERALLRRLSVFAGGWSFEAAQVVCGEGLREDILDLLIHLVDKSLVAVEEQTAAEEARYRLLETIRQYARDKLFESGDAEQLRNRHLDYFLHFAETAEPKLRSAEQLVWLDWLENEHDNLRTALAWSLESGKSDRALELAGALSYFWLLRGYFTEGEKWISEALALSEREQSKKLATGKYVPADLETAQRAKALYCAAYSHLVTLDIKRARAEVEESLRLWRGLGDKWWMAAVLGVMGLIIGSEGDVQTAIARDEEGVSLAREVTDNWPLAMCLVRLGDDLKVKGADMAAARRFLEEGVAVARKAGDKAVLSEGLRELGSTYYSQGHLMEAAAVIQQALAEAQTIGSIFSASLALIELVCVSSLQNDPAKAKHYCLELWTLAKETGSPFGALSALMASGIAASFGSEPGRGVRLLAAADILFRQRGLKLTDAEGSPLVKVYKQAMENDRAQLDPMTFEQAWAEGQAMTLEQAVALATSDQT